MGRTGTAYSYGVIAGCAFGAGEVVVWGENTHRFVGCLSGFELGGKGKARPGQGLR